MKDHRRSSIPSIKEEAVIALLTESGFKKIRFRQGNIHLACPFAPYTSLHKSDEDRNPSMGVRVFDDRPAVVNCFTCGFAAGADEGRGLEKLYMHLSIHDPRFEPLIEKAIAVDEPDTEAVVSAVAHRQYLKDRGVAVRGVDEREFAEFAGTPYTKYLRSRGITKATAVAWGMGADLPDRRVVFPVRDLDGVLMGAVGRTVDPDVEPRYKNYWEREFYKSEHLFGLHMSDPSKPTVVVEGPMDALWIWQALREHGREWNAVALMGSKPSKHQIDLLVDSGKAIYVLPDKDEPGREMAKRTIDGVATRVPTYLCRYFHVESAGDPAELDPDDLNDVILAAEPAMSFRSFSRFSR